MKYDSGMKAHYSDIIAGVKSMLGKQGIEEVKRCIASADPKELREYLKEKHGRCKQGGSVVSDRVDFFNCTLNNFKLEFKHPINNSGDTELILSWSQLTTFIRSKWNDIYGLKDKVKEAMAAECECPYWNTEEPFKLIGDRKLSVSFECTKHKCDVKNEEDLQKVLDNCAKWQECPYAKAAPMYTYFEALKEVYPGLTKENLLDAMDYDFCPGEFFDGADDIYSNGENCDGDCKRCWNQQAAFGYKPSEGVEIPEEWKAESEMEGEEQETTSHDFPCDSCQHDVNGCCDYPDTPDDYCVMGDKQVPVENGTALPETVAEDKPVIAVFDYSELENDTAAALKNCEIAIRKETAGYFTLIGAKLKEAQELLADHSNGTFEKWYTSLGLKRQTVYNLIQRYEFLSSPTIGGREETFEALPLTLSYEVSKPAAPPELVEKVLDGDITSSAEYKKLKAELDEANRKAEFWINANSETNKENQQLRADRVTAMNRADNAERELSKAKDRIEELESRPVEVAVQTDTAALEEKDRLIEKLKSQLSAEAASVDELNRKNAELRNELEQQENDDVKIFAVKLTYEQLEKLIEIVDHQNYYHIAQALKKAQSIRIK